MGCAARPTTLESHFLGVSCGPTEASIYGIEILVYVTNYSASAAFPRFETTFFVSKADTSGYLPRNYASFVPKKVSGSSEGPQRESTVKVITSTFLKHLIDEHLYLRPDVSKVSISLFARAQNQYLFPDSVSVKGKHILSDRELIRWWCRVLDPLFQEAAESEDNASAEAYLLVPGMDKYEVRNLFPPSTRFPQNYPEVKHHWIHGHPFKTSDILGPREVIPYFPDDPKSRFLDELNYGGLKEDEYGKKLGSGWRTIRTLDQFWETMSFRQECCDGKSVGFIWVEIVRKNPDLSITAAESKKPVIEKHYKQLPGEFVFDTDNMSKLMDFLTTCPPDGTSDFCTPELAKTTTEEWIKLALKLVAPGPSALPGLRSGYDWGARVKGKRAVEEVDAEGKAGVAAQPVNVLGVRRKRDSENVNVLQVRKKPKNEEEKKAENKQLTTGEGVPVNILTVRRATKD